MRTTQLKRSNRCPNCLRKIDACSDLIGNAAPKPGDITVCIYCALVMTFADDLSPAGLTEQEFAAIQNSSELRGQLERIVGAVRFMHSTKD